MAPPHSLEPRPSGARLVSSLLSLCLLLASLQAVGCSEPEKPAGAHGAAAGEGPAPPSNSSARPQEEELTSLAARKALDDEYKRHVAAVQKSTYKTCKPTGEVSKDKIGQALKEFYPTARYPKIDAALESAESLLGKKAPNFFSVLLTLKNLVEELPGCLWETADGRRLKKEDVLIAFYDEIIRAICDETALPMDTRLSAVSKVMPGALLNMMPHTTVGIATGRLKLPDGPVPGLLDVVQKREKGFVALLMRKSRQNEEQVKKALVLFKLSVFGYNCVELLSRSYSQLGGSMEEMHKKAEKVIESPMAQYLYKLLLQDQIFLLEKKPDSSGDQTRSRRVKPTGKRRHRGKSTPKAPTQAKQETEKTKLPGTPEEEKARDLKCRPPPAKGAQMSNGTPTVISSPRGRTILGGTFIAVVICAALMSASLLIGHIRSRRSKTRHQAALQSSSMNVPTHSSRFSSDGGYGGGMGEKRRLSGWQVDGVQRSEGGRGRQQTVKSQQ